MFPLEKGDKEAVQDHYLLRRQNKTKVLVFLKHTVQSPGIVPLAAQH